MFGDAFYAITSGEAFVKNQYLAHEHRTSLILQTFLEMYGYASTNPSGRNWQRDTNHVILCLADDYNVSGADLTRNPSNWFNKTTVVITDNHIMFEPGYRVIQLPTSYFGIFYYKPDTTVWQPTKRFNLSINRCDYQRQQILFELLKQSGGLDQLLRVDHVNFNGYSPESANQTQQDLVNSFDQHWQGVKPCEYADVVNNLPIKNHSMQFEQAQVSAWLNIVVETYAGDSTHAFSEKIFRALVTPAPWVLFSAMGAIAYLRHLGFDTLDDVVSHEYDTLLHDGKIPQFISNCVQNYTVVSAQSLTRLQHRCISAANHNQRLLLSMRKQWPDDFVNWLPSILDHLR